MTHDKPHGFQMLSLEILCCCRVGFDLLVSQLTCSSHELQPQEKQIQFNLYDKFVSQKHVPEYVCTCCDQLCFKCSVVKCDPNKYKACSPDIVETCLTGFTSVDDTERICITCNSSLKKSQ